MTIENLLRLVAVLLCFVDTALGQSYDELCKEFLAMPNPTIDEPTAEEKIELSKSCDSEALYYGIGQAADLRRARACTYIELSKEHSPYTLNGAPILTNIYANGSGVERNIPLAKKFACIALGSPAENDGRLKHLTNIEKGTDQGRFDFCDDIMSGAMMGVCTELNERIRRPKRDERLSSLRQKLTPSQQTIFIEYQSAANEYATAQSEGEVDQSGTARNMFVIEAKQAIITSFVQDVEKLVSGEITQYSPTDFEMADRELNRAYKALLKIENFPVGISIDGIKTAQRAWLNYRDARVRFGQSLRGDWSTERLMTEPTLERARMLGELLKNVE